jgi:hypothetical protein
MHHFQIQQTELAMSMLMMLAMMAVAMLAAAAVVWVVHRAAAGMYGDRITALARPRRMQSQSDATQRDGVEQETQTKRRKS